MLHSDLKPVDHGTAVNRTRSSYGIRLHYIKLRRGKGFTQFGIATNICNFFCLVDKNINRNLKWKSFYFLFLNPLPSELLP